MIDRKKLWKTVLTSWLFTLLGFLNLLIIMVLMSILALRFMGPRGFIAVILPLFAGMTFMFLLSETVVNIVMRARQPDKNPNSPDAAFVAAVKNICRKKRMRIRPRMRILRFRDMPNAMAYGIGFPGLAAVGVTEELLEMLTPQELEGVVAHEIAHIRCRDVGLMTLMVMITGIIEKLKDLFLGGKTVLGRGPAALALGGVLWFLSRVVFAFLRCAVSQERELAADALGSSYVGSPTPLMRALRKLEFRRPRQDTSVFDDLFVSHPGMDERIRSLEQLQSETTTSTTTKGTPCTQ